MVSTIPVVSPNIPQEYQILYLQVDGNYLTEVQSITVNRTDGGSDVETLVRDYAGRVKGSAKADITVRGVIPYDPTDQDGEGFSSGGMITGNQVQLDQTMLSALNQNSNKPVQFVVDIGYPHVQQLFFKGFIHGFTVDVAVGKQSNFTFTASGQFSVFG